MAAGEKGQSIGGLIGGAAGSVIPGVGTAIGSAVGQGLGGLIGSGIDKKNANKSMPDQVDPLELSRLNKLNQISKSISTGSDVGTQSAINQARSAGAQTQGQIAKVTGGDVGGTVSGLLKAQKGTQTATNNAVAQGQNRLPFFENLAGQLNQRISQRKLELGLLERNQLNAESAQSGKNALLNLNAVAATEGSLPGGERDMLGDLLAKTGGAIGQGAQTLARGAAAGLTGLFAPRSSNQPEAGTTNTTGQNLLPGAQTSGNFSNFQDFIEAGGNASNPIPNIPIGIGS